MQELANRIKSAAGLSGSLLVGQMLFAVAFVSSCEVPNFMSPQPATNACLERWMAVSALFIPSGLSKGSAPLPVPAQPQPLVTPRQVTRRTATKTTATKKP